MPWRPKASPAPSPSTSCRSSASPPSRGGCPPFCAAFAKPPPPWWPRGPDVLVIIDSPDFTHRVARRVRAADPSIPIVDYVSPSVWAWRPARARAMRAYIDHVLAILPFEPDVHARLGGPPCTYVGHPLSERAARSAPQRTRRNAGGSPIPRSFWCCPAAGPASSTGCWPFSRNAIALTAERVGPLDLVLPTVPPSRRPAARGDRVVAQSAPHRGRARRKERSLPRRPRRSGEVGHRHARAGRRRRARW